ncbi:MAG: PQQ-binding-like beta-propeller repeat protein [Spirochaetota bacterium]
MSLTRTAVLIIASITLLSAAGNWPAWRGPDANGYAQGDPPITWSETKNIKWKTPIPGKGHGSPIVWGNTIIVLTAADAGNKIKKFTVIAVDRANGKTLWENTVCEAKPHEGTHSDGSYASASPLCDGERIYAFFGSQGLYCLDMKGKQLWKKEFGRMKMRFSFGEGSSPALSEKALIIVWDNEGPSWVTALDKKTGDELWKKQRDERSSWATPLVMKFGGDEIAVVSASKRIRTYAMGNGDIVWEASGMTMNTIPTPVSDGKTVYLMSGFTGNSLLAISLADARGYITNFVWQYKHDTSYVPSALLMNGLLYFLKWNDALLTVIDTKTGRPLAVKQRIDIPGGVYSSPVGVNGRVYITSRKGVTAVLRAEAPFHIISTNALSDQFSASAAVVGNEMILRGHHSLYCIAEK